MSAESIRVLVVDDNPATLYSTARVLRSTGWTVLEAATGTDALALVENNIDVVVLDVNLPDIHGFEVCRRIRALPELSRLPVIHASATFVKDVDKAQGLDLCKWLFGPSGRAARIGCDGSCLCASVACGTRSRAIALERATWRADAEQQIGLKMSFSQRYRTNCGHHCNQSLVGRRC